jgi:hypothetical protein
VEDRLETGTGQVNVPDPIPVKTQKKRRALTGVRPLYHGAGRFLEIAIDCCRALNDQLFQLIVGSREPN